MSPLQPVFFIQLRIESRVLTGDEIFPGSVPLIPETASHNLLYFPY